MESQPQFAMKENPQALKFFQAHQVKIYKSTDRLFAMLMTVQFVAGLVIALILSPLTWAGTESSIHPHVWAAVLIGGAISSLPIFLALKFPGEKITRYTIAVSQILMSALLIHLTGGRIETHFHIFGSLAFLAFYRDWRVLGLATIVTIFDHVFRGWFYPQSIYGILTGGEWRWVEHACWVVFEDTFLFILCRQSLNELGEIAVSTFALNSVEKRYRAVVEQITDGIVLMEPENLKIIDCNEAFSKLIGCRSIKEAKTLTGFDFVTTSREELRRFTELLMEQKSPFTGERLYRRRDNSTIQVEINASPIIYNGKYVFCLSVKDITKRKRAEEELKRLAIVAEKTQNSVVVSGPDGCIQWTNEGFTRMTGYQAGEVLGKHPVDILCGEETSSATLKAISNAVKAREPFNGELYNYRKDGEGIWISRSLTPINDEDGSLTGYISIETDITERKKMENALRRTHDELELRVGERTSELVRTNADLSKEVTERKRAETEVSEARQFLHKVIDNIPNMIFVKDEKGCYTLANQALASLYGVEVDDLLGKTDGELIRNSAEAEIFLNHDREVIETQQEKFVGEEKFTDPKGNTHWLQTVKRPISGKSGLKNILGIATDLTERKILENQLRHSQKLESIGQLAAGIAHEINTPTQYVGDNTRFLRDAFNGINLALEKYGELLEAARNGEVTPELVAEVDERIEDSDLTFLIEESPNAIQQSLEGISRIAKIVLSMKNFAHPGTKEKTAADINKAIESTVAVARNEWKYVAELEMIFDDKLPLVPCLLGDFNQVILNIIINASHSIADVVGDGSRGKGKITITTRGVTENWVEIRITDTGRGIPPEAQEHIFDPFFTTKEVGQGTGQGLAISHTVIVEKHEGKLNFETVQGQGTTFIIQLPLGTTEKINIKRAA